MIPGFQRKMRELAGRVQDWDKSVRIELGTMKKQANRQVVPFDVVFNVAGQESRREYQMVEQGDTDNVYRCALQLRGQRPHNLSHFALDSVDLPMGLLLKVASRCLMEQLIDGLPKALKPLNAKLETSVIDREELFIAKDGQMYGYELEVEFGEMAQCFHVELEDTEGAEWSITIPCSDMSAAPILEKIVQDPSLVAGWKSHHASYMSCLALSLEEMGYEVELEDSLQVEFGNENYATVDVQRTTPERFEISYECPGSMYNDSPEFEAMTKFQIFMRGLTPEKLVKGSRERRHKVFKPEVETGGETLDTSLSLI